MIKWFHHLLNPHCTHCAAEKEHEELKAAELESCASCKILILELEKTQRLNETLLSRLLERPTVEEPVVKNDPQPLKTGGIPWNVKRDMLEREAREAARVLAEKNRELTVPALEKILGVEDNAS